MSAQLVPARGSINKKGGCLTHLDYTYKNCQNSPATDHIKHRRYLINTPIGIRHLSEKANPIAAIQSELIGPGLDQSHDVGRVDVRFVFKLDSPAAGAGFDLAYPNRVCLELQRGDADQ